MAFKLDQSGTLVQQANVPSSTAAGRGSYLVSDGAGGAFWAYLGNTATAGQVDNSQWLYRTIYTHGYLACGYKGSNPWRTLNKTWHPTETTIYCGEQISGTQGYTNGNFSDYYGYIIAGSGFNVASSVISSYNLHSGAIRTFSADGYSSDGVTYGYSGNDPKNEGVEYGTAGYGGDVGGMRMHATRLDGQSTQDIKGQHGYHAGGGRSADGDSRHHFPTEVMYKMSNAPHNGRGDATYGELKGFFRSSGNNVTYTLTWSNTSWSNGGWTSGSVDVHGKMMGSKHGHFYAENSTNVTWPKIKVNSSTGATISTFNKVRAYGESNNEDGQDNGYVMGHYDGQQNNHTIRQSYSTDTEVTLGAAAQPKGHYGQSSGACSTAAATVAVLGN